MSDQGRAERCSSHCLAQVALPTQRGSRLIDVFQGLSNLRVGYIQLLAFLIVYFLACDLCLEKLLRPIELGLRQDLCRLGLFPRWLPARE